MSTLDGFEVEVDDPEGTGRSYGADEKKGLYKLNIDPENKPPKKTIEKIWSEYADKIVLAIGILLVAGISYQAGFLKGQKNRKEPVVVNQAACAPCPDGFARGDEAKTSAETKKSNSATGGENASASSAESRECAYVASKNSNKLHLPTCQFAQKIKQENKICFSSKEEAEGRGYQSAKCCIK